MTPFEFWNNIIEKETANSTNEKGRKEEQLNIWSRFLIIQTPGADEQSRRDCYREISSLGRLYLTKEVVTLEQLTTHHPINVEIPASLRSEIKERILLNAFDNDNIPKEDFAEA